MPATVLGGRLHPEISLVIDGELPVSAQDYSRNKALSAGRKTYPRVPVENAHPHRLAVVGGGFSIERHVGTLRAWPGDVWAINGAWGWCRDRDIEATLFSCDPDPILLKSVGGVRKALLGTMVDPAVFEALGDADVAVFDPDGSPGSIAGNGSTATCAPHLAARMGYLEGVTFFGCESCYLPGQTHAYQHESRADELLVMAGGNEYLTAPDYYYQAKALSELIRALPEFLSEESGGLLRALVRDPDFHIRWVSESLAARLRVGAMKDAA